MVSASIAGSFGLQIILIFLYFFSCAKVSAGLDILSPGRPLYSNETLISKRSKCELGFFSPGNSTNIYVGIWYKLYLGDQTIVWVANREAPMRSVSDNSRLELGEDGSLMLFNDLNEKIWVVNNYVGFGSVRIRAVLLDDANFVVSDGLSMIWQSFDYPTHTWLPGMNLGNFTTSTNRRRLLTCWKNLDDPAPGNFSLGIETKNDQVIIWTNESQIIWRSGAWNGQNFSSFPTSFISFHYVSNDQDTYFGYDLDENIPSMFVLSHKGEINELVWSERALEWNVFSSQPVGDCSGFALCGPNGLCTRNSTPLCQCIDGFKPSVPDEWRLAAWTFGCVRTKTLQCNDIGFRPMAGISMPANSQTANLNSTQVCESACLGNCSCTAYSYSNGRCSLWTGDLLDMRADEHFQDTRTSENSQAVLYLRSSPIPSSGVSKNKKKSYVPVVVSTIIPFVICVSLLFLLWNIRRIKNRKRKGAEKENKNILFLDLETSTDQNTNGRSSTLGEKKVFDLPHFSFTSISAATNDFSPVNKLGEGGFGPVYKGNLLGGHSVAVKRLSKRSGQGLEELRNETALIAKVQHRNLVRLLGCCIEQDEKILIYEYMSNKSLDHFIFDPPSKQDLLDWERRVQIIEGIAQGLLYLHLHSRLRIVHRDLKASNILLDGKMTPKISDFGMARIIGGDELQANTNRIVGTYGYMSPEYAMEGLFSIKSDVFAFGVLLLEILSGRKNTGFRHSDCLTLLGYAWELWEADRVLELVDSKLDIPSSFVPVRLIHVGLLCVQQSPEDRPTMSNVLVMFSNENIQLVSPKRPAYTSGGSSGSGSGIDKADNVSVNKLTASVMKGR